LEPFPRVLAHPLQPLPEAPTRRLAPLGGEEQPDPHTQHRSEQHPGGESAERPEPRIRSPLILLVVHGLVDRVVGAGVVAHPALRIPLLARSTCNLPPSREPSTIATP